VNEPLLAGEQVLYIETLDWLQGNQESINPTSDARKIAKYRRFRREIPLSLCLLMVGVEFVGL
jgi:hypothetical protein